MHTILIQKRFTCRACHLKWPRIVHQCMYEGLSSCVHTPPPLLVPNDLEDLDMVFMMHL